MLMTDPPAICIKDYNYVLPVDRIAQFPLPVRDASRLLIHRDGLTREAVFSSIDAFLPAKSLLVFNNTRVIRARIFFSKPTGARIEIFCLEPVTPSVEILTAFGQKESCTWKCLVGNLKRWKSGTITAAFTISGVAHELAADRVNDYNDGSFEIKFHWQPPELAFSEILDLAGTIPLPPYITRPSEPSDNDRYQTVYASRDGSVAAPTAGLHFTAGMLSRLKESGFMTENVTLHVGTGTFRPVAVADIRDHIMHHEKIVVPVKVIETLLAEPHRPVIAVGTTSARTLESLYWLGVRLLLDGQKVHPVVDQWYPYLLEGAGTITVKRSLEALADYLRTRRMNEYSGETQLMIVPGYRYKIISGLITNFHMPQSTLLLLVAAMIGDDWKKAYDYALMNGFRFLSYGDACLFFVQRK